MYRDVGILEVLGNETRRRILELLAKGPRYLLQLSRELNVSQQAILKHINVLMQAGLIRSYESKVGSLGPSRKYYELVKPISMTVTVFRGFSEIEFYEIDGEVPKSVEEALKDVEEAIRGEDIRDELLSKAKMLVQEIDDELRRIRKREKALLNAKYRILRLIYESLRRLEADSLGGLEERE
ncbi:MAG: helix-turn-helix domain-containing protein [Candidatus Nezhaarchaeota archaeon]|nr:helix-turn-helix domain-containing protein [Candidatus Nezhaarchaeota archaeon]